MRTLALLALPALYLSSLSGAADVLRIGDRHIRDRLRESTGPARRLPKTWVVRTVTPDGRNVTSNSGGSISADGALTGEPPTVDGVFIPALSWANEAEAVHALGNCDSVCAWLRRAHAARALIAAHHTAVFIVAETGLLNGLSASVPPAFETLFRQRYPRVRCDATQPVVRAGSIVTAAALDQGLRLSCHLVGRFGSHIVSSRTVREVLHASHSSNLKALPTDAAADPLVERAQNWLLVRMNDDPALPELARHLAISERTLFRRFRAALGITPIAYLQTLRLETAKSMLERTDVNTESVAQRVGYADASFFVKLFRKRFGCTPSAYRAHATGVGDGSALPSPTVP